MSEIGTLVVTVLWSVSAVSAVWALLPSVAVVRPAVLLLRLA